MDLRPHHAETIRNLVPAMERDPQVRALVLGGSIAHGFARPDSDVDVTIVLDGDEYRRRATGGMLHYNNRTLCTYDGYIDGKYVDLGFLRDVAARGSDPARYAYCDARILFTREPGLAEVLAAIARFPVEEKAARRERFTAQLLAWRWYYSEGRRQENEYLVTLAVQKLVLFACRFVLNENERLYPYHKWMLRVTAAAPRQPADLMADIAAVLARPPWETVDAFVRGLLAFHGVDFAAADARWPTQFMKDTELAWMTGHPPIDDL